MYIDEKRCMEKNNILHIIVYVCNSPNYNPHNFKSNKFTFDSFYKCKVNDEYRDQDYTIITLVGV